MSATYTEAPFFDFPVAGRSGAWQGPFQGSPEHFVAAMRSPRWQAVPPPWDRSLPSIATQIPFFLSSHIHDLSPVISQELVRYQSLLALKAWILNSSAAQAIRLSITYVTTIIPFRTSPSYQMSNLDISNELFLVSCFRHRTSVFVPISRTATTAPDVGEGFEQITQDYHSLILPGLTLWQHPRFFAYFPSPSSFEGVLGDSMQVESIPILDLTPACTELEAVVTDWAAKMLCLDPAFYNTSEVGGGAIQTTASDAALVAAVVARSRYVRQHPGLILALNVRVLEVSAEDNYALRGTTLKQALEEDSRDGLYPFILIATIGSTSSGAIDRLGELGDIVASTPSLWLHVDAAWAGIAMACPEYRELCLLNDINKYADSFCVNFHKALGPCQFRLFRTVGAGLTDALDVTPEFLRSEHGDADTVIDYRNWHLGLGSRFRALKLWFVMRSYGVQGFQRYIRQAIHLLSTGHATVSVFRLVPPIAVSDSSGSASAALSQALDTAHLNALNPAFYARLSARHDVAFTRTDLNGYIICIRCAVGAARTEEVHIRQAFEVL